VIRIVLEDVMVHPSSNCYRWRNERVQCVVQVKDRALPHQPCGIDDALRCQKVQGAELIVLSEQMP
jgi:hypothetical protein